ncbi:MAG TPA: C10 family peptidase, partial [Pseudosphingobacterium sp.]|nr:C10 family peptidase [Pseudosphingobacterium sp.]
CKKGDSMQAVQTDFTVTQEKVKEVANLLTLVPDQNGDLSKKSGVKSLSIKREVESVTPYPSADDPAFYIINYKDNQGWILLSADKRAIPVLASSAEGHFSLNMTDHNINLVGWMESAVEQMTEIKNTPYKEDEKTGGGIKALWDEPCPDGLLKGIDPDMISTMTVCELDPCDAPADITIPEKLVTRWGQGYGYNDALANMGCPGNGKPPVGCVATSMAQIMKYYNYPNTYNWALMPNTYASAETARLMRDIGSAVDMNYACGSSGADTQGEVANAFKNDFGYSSASYQDFNTTLFFSEIQAGRPVIIRGGTNVNGNYTNGHAWVADGAQRFSVCNWDYETGEVTSIYLYYWGHMNWGWDGSENGFYQIGNFNNANGSFNYKTGLIYNIRP